MKLNVWVIALLLWSQLCNGQQRLPNIIFILTDDQRHDALGAMGNTIIQTPHLDRLAQKGIVYQNAHVTTSICSVSRASILSGQYLSRHQIDDFAKNFSPSQLANTYPLLLKEAGYTIGFAGKYGVGNQPPEEVFDFWACNKAGQPPYEYIRPNGEVIHHTDSVSNSAQLFLKEYGTKGPFCLSLSFKAPHELDGSPPTFPVQKKWKQTYEGVTFPKSITHKANYWEQHPDFFRTDENIARERWKPLFATDSAYQSTVRSYYQLITGVDAAVGEIIQRLEALNLSENTIIIFTSDNGFHLGEHGLQGKWFAFQESIRVPLIIYDPRAKPKSNTSQQLVLNIDLAPTILQFAGITPPASMQGHGIYSQDNKRDSFFYEHTFLGSPRLPKVEAVVESRFKYVIYTEHQHELLFDLKRDPNETTNLVNSSKYKKQLVRLRQKHSLLKQQAL